MSFVISYQFHEKWSEKKVVLKFSAIFRVFCDTDKRYWDGVRVKFVEQIEYDDFVNDTNLLSFISYAINDKQNIAFFAKLIKDINWVSMVKVIVFKLLYNIAKNTIMISLINFAKYAKNLNKSQKNTIFPIIQTRGGCANAFEME